MPRHDPTTAALDVQTARAKVLQAITSGNETEVVSIAEAVGRVVADNITAQYDSPPFRNSAMDGYAVSCGDIETGKPIPVAGVSLAGHPYTEPVVRGEAVRITTGAMMPDASDSIVIQENTSAGHNHVTINKLPNAGQHVRHPGDDIKKGQLLVTSGQFVGAATAGLLAAQGYRQITVRRRARIGIFSTGDELCEPGETLAPGQIYDSNRITLNAMLSSAGATVTDLGIVRDTRDAVDRALRQTGDFDFIVSSGGVSVGEADFIKAALTDNAELLFWKIAMKPGKPLVSAQLKSGAMYFGLPGNPVSSMVTCAHFVVPAVRKFSSLPHPLPVQHQATTVDTLRKEVGRFEFQRGYATRQPDNTHSVSSTGLQDSHVLSSMSAANCFICLPRYSSGAIAGSQVDIILFDDISGLR